MTVPSVSSADGCDGVFNGPHMMDNPQMEGVDIFAIQDAARKHEDGAFFHSVGLRAVCQLLLSSRSVRTVNGGNSCKGSPSKDAPDLSLSGAANSPGEDGPPGRPFFAWTSSPVELQQRRSGGELSLVDTPDFSPCKVTHSVQHTMASCIQPFFHSFLTLSSSFSLHVTFPLVVQFVEPLDVPVVQHFAAATPIMSMGLQRPRYRASCFVCLQYLILGNGL